MKNNKGFSLVELIIVIAIMAILVGVMAPQLIKYIEKSKVSSDTQVADTVHSAILDTALDPEVVQSKDASNFISSMSDGTFKSLSSFIAQSNEFCNGVKEVLGVTSAQEVSDSLKSNGASNIMVALDNNHCVVSLPGTDSTGSKRSASYEIVVD